MHWQLRVCSGTPLILLAWQGLVTNSVQKCAHLKVAFLFKNRHQHGFKHFNLQLQVHLFLLAEQAIFRTCEFECILCMQTPILYKAS